MAQSKMTDSTFAEDDKPLLKKWGKIVTRRVFSGNSFVNSSMKKSLLQVMEAIRHSVNPQVCVQQQSVPELLCYLPYLIGFACETGYLHHIQVNISKPILMVSNTTADASYLMETISAPTAPNSKSLLQSKQILTDSEIANGAHYRSYLIAASDSTSFADLDIKYDVIVCTTDCLPHLPRRDFSLVIGQDTWDPALTGFQIFCSVVLLKYSSSACITAPSLTESSGPRLIVYSDMIASGECAMPKLLEPQIRGIEEMMDRVTDFNCSHIPIELNVCGLMGLKELIYALPSLLGSAAISNASCLDLYKPVLFLTTDVAAYELVSGVLPVTVPIEDKETTIPNPKELYRCCLLKNEFEVCTFCQQINSSEVVLTSTEFARDKSENSVVTNTFYKNFQSYNLSAVVIVQTEYLPNKKEEEILYHFRGATTIVIKGNAKTEKDKEDGSIAVVPKLLTVQKISAELISPTLMTHGNDITERFLLSQKSVLTHYQQVGLANIVEWLGSSSNSSRQVAHVTTAIGFKYAAMMLWCLPTMLEWANNNQLIPDGAVNLKKALLILCIGKESLNEIWNMVNSKNSFHQTSLLRSVDTCSDGNILSYLAANAESATNTINIAGKYKIIFSDISYLDYLPEAAFSDILVFKEGPISDDNMNAITEKYAEKSKIVFFTANEVGPMKKFDLLNNCEFQGSQIQDIQSAQVGGVAANETSCLSEIVEKSVSQESTVSDKLQQETPAGKPLLINNISQKEKEQEEETTEAGITAMQTDSNAEISSIENASKKSECNACVQEIIVALEEICEAENVQESIVALEEICQAENDTKTLPEKKKRRKLTTIFKKKSKSHKTRQENASNYTDSAVTTNQASSHLEAHTQSEFDSENPPLKKTSKWSKCKKFLRRFSPKKKKESRQKDSLPSESICRPYEMEENINDEHHSTGLFMCWRRNRSHNKKSDRFIPGQDCLTLEECQSTPQGTLSAPGVNTSDENEIADGHSDVMTWTDPVIYLTSNRPAILSDCAVDMPEENLDIDAVSFLSVYLSDPSSIDIISLTERDNSVAINASGGKAIPLKADMTSEPNLNFQGVPCVPVSGTESCIDLQDIPLASPSHSESHLDFQDVSYCSSSSFESIESLLNAIDGVDIPSKNITDNSTNYQPKTTAQK